jgi:hypothetical protein
MRRTQGDALELSEYSDDEVTFLPVTLPFDTVAEIDNALDHFRKLGKNPDREKFIYMGAVRHHDVSFSRKYVDTARYETPVDR